jgi:hypothetical protein
MRTPLHNPTAFKVTNSQTITGASASGNDIFQLTLQSGEKTVQIRSTHNYPVGSSLILQTHPSGQLEIRNNSPLKQSLLKQSLLKTRLQTLDGPTPALSSHIELRRPLTQLIHQLHEQAIQHQPPAKHYIKLINALIQSLDHLKTLRIPLETLDGKALKAYIARSGLFMERQLSHAEPDRASNAAPSTIKPNRTNLGNKSVGHTISVSTDLKATLHQLIHHLKAAMVINQTQVQTTTANTSPSVLLESQNMASTGKAGLGVVPNTLTGTTIPTQAIVTQPEYSRPLATAPIAESLLYNQTLAKLKTASANGPTALNAHNAQLTTLLKARSAEPQAGASQSPFILNQTIAISAFLSFLAKLSQSHNITPSSPKIGSTPSLNGWDTLLALLFSSPRRLSQTSAHPATSGLSQQLAQLLTAAQTQVTALTTKQLYLLNQKEMPGEFKTLLAIDLPVQVAQEIYQTPLNIAEKNSHASEAPEAHMKTWKIELGFDLGDIGLIRIIALYTKGSLDLTFQTQNSEAKNLITTRLPSLTQPLARLGISLDTIHFSPYTEDTATHASFGNTLEKIISIEL